MKKIKQIALTLLVVSFLVNPMYLILRVHAVNEEIAMSRISNTLQSVMESGSEDESIEVMIWLEDINTSSSVLSSSEDILEVANGTLPPRGLCEVSITDAEAYTQYMYTRKELLRELCEAYTQSFAESFLYDEEIIYLSKYAPVVVCELSVDRIIEISRVSFVYAIDFYNDALVRSNSDNELFSINENVISPQSNTSFYSVSNVLQSLGVYSLRTYVDNWGDGIRIGIIDQGYIRVYSDFVENNNIDLTEHYSSYDATVDGYRHPTQVLEILYSIVPDAEFYYANYWDNASADEDNVFTLCEEVEWLLSKNVQIISCSLSLEWDSNHSIIEDENSTYGLISSYLDYIINEYDVVYVMASGNSQTVMSNGAMSYNSITVGNYDMANNLIAQSSSYYNGTDLARKPDVCAPGYYLFNSTGLSDSGTSYAAPLVAGVAALIISSASGFIYHGEVKAIICASTYQHRYAITDENYKQYGAGVINGFNIREIISDNNSLYSGIAPDTTSISHSIYINHEEFNSADIVLVFECNTGDNYVYNIANLNIYLYDFEGELIASSSTTNSNVEVLRNIPNYDEDYTLVIEQVTPALYNDTSAITHYAISWCYQE